jgi:two-component system response regulator RegX3
MGVEVYPKFTCAPAGTMLGFINMKPRLLIIEDEAAIRTGLTDVFVYHGYDVTTAVDGQAGLEAALRGSFDLILLDIMLPKTNGYDVCEAIRARDRDQPIIMLTARVSDEDIVKGLKLGADDYVGKPFSIEQLVLRAAAVLRRAGLGPDDASFLNVGNLVIDTRNLSGVSGTEVIAFTRREMQVLQYLHAHSERPVPREELLSRVWGYACSADLETRTVDIHIAKLRRKIEPDPKDPRFLVTVRGAGYRLLNQP